MQKKPSRHSFTAFLFLILFTSGIHPFAQDTTDPLRIQQDAVLKEKDFAEDISPLTSVRCDVYLTGSKLKNVQLTPHSDSSLYAIKGDRKREVLYSDITKIVFRSSGSVGRGFVVGAAAGFTIGFLKFGLNRSSLFDPGQLAVGAMIGLMLSVPGGLIGGVIGLFASGDEEFIFEKIPEREKINRINCIIRQYSN